MTWKYYRLKFTDQAEADELLRNEFGGFKFDSTIEIGYLYDEETHEQLDGWHINLALQEDLPTELEAFIVEPKNIKIAFFGEL